MGEDRVADILIHHRAEANRMGFRAMIAQLRHASDHSWKKHSVTKSGVALEDAAAANIAFVQTLQQLGRYQEASMAFSLLLSKVDAMSDPVEMLHRKLGHKLGDDALTIYFHLSTSKSNFGTLECRSHLKAALNTLKVPHNRSEFFWRLCTDRLVAGKTIDFDRFQSEFGELTDGGNTLAATANLLWVKSVQFLQHARQARSTLAELRYLEEALACYEQAKGSSDKLLLDLSHPHLTTHTMLCGCRHTIMLRKRIESLKGDQSLDGEFRKCLAFIELLMADTGIKQGADGYRENTQVLRALQHEWIMANPTNPLADNAWLRERYSSDPSRNLMTMVDLLKF